MKEFLNQYFEPTNNGDISMIVYFTQSKENVFTYFYIHLGSTRYGV